MFRLREPQMESDDNAAVDRGHREEEKEEKERRRQDQRTTSGLDNADGKAELRPTKKRVQGRPKVK